jgi:protein-S-isoprenylcysteine O-methyltransferase Ste14
MHDGGNGCLGIDATGREITPEEAAMTSSMDRSGQLSDDLRPAIRQRFTQVLIQFLIQFLVLFLSAGTLRWWEGWVYVALYLVSVAIFAVFMLRLNPGAIAERGRAAAAGGWKQWDRIIGLVVTVIYFIGVLAVAGLDERFGWTAPMALATQLVAFVVYAAGAALFGWSMITNSFFSTVVRIQDDRGQVVCDRGPYRFVRHPGYVGFILQSLTAPVMLGSLWALIPGALSAILLVVRTALEDRTLQQELGGYADYARRVRYRLLPGVW